MDPKVPESALVLGFTVRKPDFHSGPGRPLGGPGRSPRVCIIRAVPAWKRPGKVSGALTCPWAPLLPPGPASWPAHSLQFTPSTTGRPQVGFAELKKNREKKRLLAIFLPCAIKTGPDRTAGLGGPCWARGVEGMVVRCSARTLAVSGYSVKKNRHAGAQRWTTPTSSFAVGWLLFCTWHAAGMVHALAHSHKKMHWQWLHADSLFYYHRLATPNEHAQLGRRDLRGSCSITQTN